MRGHSHIIAGLAAALALNQVQPYLSVRDGPALALAAGACVLGALLPDVDSATSTIRNATGTGARPDWTARRVLRAVGLRRGLVFWFFYGVLLAVFSLLGLFTWLAVRTIAGGHRGRTHTLLALALLGAGAWYLGLPPWALAFLAGYASHLIADSLTRSGIPILWPITPWRFHLLPFGIRITTGSWLEYALVLPLTAWTIYAMVRFAIAA